MRVTALELENFKGIGRRQRIELKPITLLFGPNSAGKSMIIQALHYLHGILKDGELDPQSFLGGQIDVGGFRQMLHRHDLDRTMVIAVHLEDMADEDAAWIARDWIEDLGFTVGFDRAKVNLQLGWSATGSAPHVSRLEIVLDDLPFTTIEAAPDGRRVAMTELNFAHPLLSHRDFSVEALLSERNVLARIKDPPPGEEPGRPLPLGLDPSLTVGAAPRINRELPIVLDADPDWGPPYRTAEDEQLGAFLHLISFGVDVPLATLERELGLMLHVGPFRAVPHRGFVPHESLQSSPEHWYSGLAGYGLLAETARRRRNEDARFVADINIWLAGDALNTGYQLDLKRTREIPADHWLIDALEAGDVLDVAGKVPDVVRALPERARIVITDERTKTELAPADVGVGFSQVVPIIAAAILGRSIVAIEQPELHLHPAQQVALGDLFLYAALEAGDGLWGPASGGRTLAEAWAKTFLIETHSEHLILRFLRRIRKSSGDDSEPPILKPDEIAVHWIEPHIDGAVIRRLRIDEEGDFIDPWPRGFFEEREDELFG